jgi:NTP pyrophosphatase (non-canonical NTP hydrolase)
MTQHERTEHLLACLAEESGEVTQLVGKCLRFGISDHHPKTGNIPNIELLQREYNDLLAVAETLGLYRDPALIAAKQERIRRYMDYAAKNKRPAPLPEPG